MVLEPQGRWHTLKSVGAYFNNEGGFTRCVDGPEPVFKMTPENLQVQAGN